MVCASQELKLFCDKFNLDFPSFSFVTEDEKIICKCNWYNVFTISGDKFYSPSEAVTSCLIALSNWVEKDQNFINLITIHNNTNMFTR